MSKWREEKGEVAERKEDKLAPFLKDDFLESEADFWRLHHKQLGITKEDLIKEAITYLKVNKKGAEKLLKGFI